MFTAKPTAIPDVLLLTPSVFPDARGSFYESYNQQDLKGLGITEEFIQDSVSTSKQWVLRGLHFQQDPYAQGKLVSVIMGEVFDVAVDLRKGSPTYGKWVGETLNDQNHSMLFIPAGFAHGFLVLSSEARFSYKLSRAGYHKEAASGVIWNDPTLNVAWPLPAGQAPLISEQDAHLPLLQ